MKEFITIVVGRKPISIIFRLFVLTFLVWVFWTPNLKILWVDGESMMPSYDDGDTVLMNINPYKKGDPRRLDPVVVWSNEHKCLLFKRIIALPGELIEIKKGHIFINGEELQDGFGEGYDDFFDMEPTFVPLNQYFVIGDNRDDSVFGFFMIEEIVGKAMY
jgi:signal peptidase I